MTKTELNKLLSKLLYQMCLNYGTALFVVYRNAAGTPTTRDSVQ